MIWSVSHEVIWHGSTNREELCIDMIEIDIEQDKQGILIIERIKQQHQGMCNEVLLLK